MQVSFSKEPSKDKFYCPNIVKLVNLTLMKIQTLTTPRPNFQIKTRLVLDTRLKELLISQGESVKKINTYSLPKQVKQAYTPIHRKLAQ